VDGHPPDAILAPFLFWKSPKASGMARITTETHMTDRAGIGGGDGLRLDRADDMSFVAMK
jgi:hypothetical protein